MTADGRWAQLARRTGVAGLLGTVLLFAPIIAISTLGEPPLHAPESEVVEFFRATSESSWFESAEAVVVIGALTLAWALVGVGLLLRRAEGEPAWRSTMVVVSAGVFAAGSVGGVAWQVAGRHGPDFDAGIAHFAYDWANVGFANTWLVLASLSLASGWVIVETGVFPRWTGWLALAACVGFVVSRFFWTGSVWLFPYAAFWLWLIVIFVRLLRTRETASATTTADSTSDATGGPRTAYTARKERAKGDDG